MSAGCSVAFSAESVIDAALRHGVAGIEREVDERKLELGEIDPHRP